MIVGVNDSRVECLEDSFEEVTAGHFFGRFTSNVESLSIVEGAERGSRSRQWPRIRSSMMVWMSSVHIDCHNVLT